MSTPRPHVAAALAVALAASGLACAHGPSPKEREVAEIHYQLGADALRNGRREEALQEFDAALAKDDAHAPAHLGKGLAFQLLRRTADAEREYRRALELDPTLSDAHNALGQLLATSGRPEQAIAEFDRALDNPAYREAYVARCNKGQALYQLGRRDEGISEMRVCLSVAPRFCPGHRDLGRMLLEQNRNREALVQLQRYADLCSGSPDAWYQLGLAQTKLGDPEKARDAFERCAAMSGDPLVEECRARTEALR